MELRRDTSNYRTKNHAEEQEKNVANDTAKEETGIQCLHWKKNGGDAAHSVPCQRIDQLCVHLNSAFPEAMPYFAHEQRQLATLRNILGGVTVGGACEVHDTVMGETALEANHDKEQQPNPKSWPELSGEITAGGDESH